MSVPFDAQRGLVIVPAALEGPGGVAILRLALDTGATGTLVNVGLLITALGQERTGFPVLCHTLPASAGVDGLLGLDFLRGQTLTVDLRSGMVTLT